MVLVCVVGAGIIGLASATVLAEGGHKVVIIARDVPGDPDSLAWASPYAGATIQLSPVQSLDSRKLQTDSFKYYWALAHRDTTSGVQVVNSRWYYDHPIPPEDAWFKTVVPHYRELRKDEIPSGSAIGASMTVCTANPVFFLPYLAQNLKERGVRFVRQTVSSLEQALDLTGADVLINATGLGAKELANDARVRPVGGQTMFVRNKAEWGRYEMREGGNEYTYAIPRMFSGGAIIGGVRKVGSDTAVVDVELKKDILRRVNALTKGAFADVNLETDVQDIVAMRPGRDGGYRLEREGRVIHAYGFDGEAYIYSFGVAKRVGELVGELLGEAKSKL